MELSDDLKNVFTETAQILKNSDRRIFMARVVEVSRDMLDRCDI